MVDLALGDFCPGSYHTAYHLPSSCIGSIHLHICLSYDFRYQSLVSDCQQMLHLPTPQRVTPTWNNDN